MPKKFSIAIIGKGRVGSSFAMRIKKMYGYELFAHLPARKKSFAALGKNDGPDVIFICSKDDQIAHVAKKVAKAAGKNLKLMVHCAGARESTILPVGLTFSRSASTKSRSHYFARLTLHPIQTFPKADTKFLKNIYYMASSNDAYAKKWAAKFVKDIGGEGIIEVRGKDLPLYHTLVVFASNFTVLIGGAIEILSKSFKISPAVMKKAVAPLMRQSLSNVLNNDARKILTGPLARKDYSTILRHRLALRKQPAGLRKIYEGFVLLADEIMS
jgi:predicted short-subunit dehydrogenase-like oxidoreductase (DUF2520 family)